MQIYLQFYMLFLRLDMKFMLVSKMHITTYIKLPNKCFHSRDWSMRIRESLPLWPDWSIKRFDLCLVSSGVNFAMNIDCEIAILEVESRKDGVETESRSDRFLSFGISRECYLKTSFSARKLISRVSFVKLSRRII